MVDTEHYKELLCDYNKLKEELKEFKRVVRLITSKVVNYYWLKFSENVGRYNMAVGTSQRLKQTEYKMLKEFFKRYE